MSFLNEAFPKVNLDNSNYSPSILENWRDKMGCSGLIGNNLSNALKMTPYGMIAYQRACRAIKNYSPPLNFNVTANRIIDPNSGNFIDAHGLTYDAGDLIICNVSTFNGTTLAGIQDRFFSCTPNELLNIVGFHEIDHLVLDSETKILSTDGVECVFCKNHKLVIGREFKARIQFSLIYPNISTSKNIWLSKYAFYFEVMYRLLHPEDDNEKSVSESFKKSRKKLKKMLAFEASPEFIQFVNNIRANAIFNNGLRVLYKYYKTVLFELENRFEAFASHDDANFTNQEKIQVQNIINNLQQYIADQNFDLIV